MSLTSYIPLTDVIGDAWPQSLGTAPDLPAVLDLIGVGPTSVVTDSTGLPAGVEIALAILDQVRFDLPFLPGFSVHTGTAGDVTPVTIRYSSVPHATVELRDLGLTFSLPATLLQRWRRAGASEPWAAHLVEGRPAGVELRLSSTITVDLETGAVTLARPDIAALGADEGVMIGSSGVLLHNLSGLRLALDDDPAAPGASFRGVRIENAEVSFIQGSTRLERFSARLSDCAIGDGGFSGRIQVTFPEGANRRDLPGGALFGVDCRLQSFDVTFTRSVPTASAISAYLHLPFFTDAARPDEWVRVDASLGGPDGQLLVQLSARSGGRLARLRKEPLFDLSLTGLALRTTEGVAGVELTGSLKPLLFEAQVRWPAFELRALRVDARGRVSLPGGQLQLPEPRRITLGGFAVELRSLSFGDTERGGRTWSSIGFSGGIRLANDLAAASFNNLRVNWPKGSTLESAGELTCDGVTVAGRIPNVLSLAGEVNFDNARSEFSGQLRIALERLNLQARAAFLVGRTPASPGPSFPYWFLNLSLELPAGVPLAATGLALYGGQALAGQNWGAQRTPEQSWFDDWYLRPAPGLGLASPTELRSKWSPQPDRFVLGAGVTVGTATDNGFVLTGKLLLVLTLPGPVIFLEGQAASLRSRGEFPTDPPFRAVVILDLEQQQLTAGLAAHYSLARVIEVRGSAEAFFSFRDPAAWHLYIGRDTPESKRITARILALFEASFYLMLDSRALKQGATVQYASNLSFGPVRLVMRVRLDERIELFWEPLQLAGFLGLSGEIRLTVFGVGLGLSVDATLQALAPKPFEVAGSLRVRLQLFWPIPEISVDLAFKWQHADPPNYFVDPLDAVRLQDSSSGRWWEVVTGDDVPGLPPPLSASPPVPLDAKPVLLFGRPVDAGRSVASIPPTPELSRAGTLGGDGQELPGVPGRFVSRLTRAVLSKWDGSAWQAITQTENPRAPWEGRVNLQRAMWGTWRPLKDREGNGAALQFELFNRYGFHFGDDLRDPYRGEDLREHGRRLCEPGPSPRRLCADFASQPMGRRFGSVFAHAPGRFTATRPTTIVGRVGATSPRALGIPLDTRLTLELDEAASELEVTLTGRRAVVVSAYSGALLVERRKVEGDVVELLTTTSPGGITSLVFDTEGSRAGGPARDFTADFVWHGSPPTAAPVPGEQAGCLNFLRLAPRPAPKTFESKDCVRVLEEMLLILCRATEGGRPERPIDKPLLPLPARVAARAARMRGVVSDDKDCGPYAGHDPAELEMLRTLFDEFRQCGAAIRSIPALVAELRNSLAELYGAQKSGGHQQALNLCEVITRAALELLALRLAEADADSARAPSAALAREAGREFFAASCAAIECPSAKDVLSPLLRAALLDARTARRQATRPRPAAAPAIVGVIEPADGSGASPQESAMATANIGAEISRLCWVSAREVEAHRNGREGALRFADLMRQFDGDEWLLEPHSTYKLQVETTMENAAVPAPGTPPPWQHTVYFRTAGPPGDFTVNDLANTLAPYLKATAPAEKETEVFRGYGVALEFNRPYVAGMYDWPTTAFRVRLFDAAEREVTMSAGADSMPAPLSLPVVWTAAASSTLFPHERILPEALAGGPCRTPVAPHRRDALAQAALPGDVLLEPRARYTAVVEAGARGSEQEVARFSFTTGRYRDFSALVSEARTTGGIVTTPAGGTWAATLRAQTPFDPPAEGAAFAAALGQVGLAPRSMAARLQTTLIESGGVAPLLLLEFPQPVDFRRLSFELLIEADVEPTTPLPVPGAALAVAAARTSGRVEPRVLRSADQVGVFIAAPDGRDLAGRRVTLLCRYSMTVLEPGRFPDAPALSYGAATHESAALTVRHRRVE